MGLKFENMPSLVPYTFPLIYLAQERSKWSMFCPPQSLYFFMDLKFENIPSFVLYTFHLIYLAQYRSKFSISVLHNTIHFIPYTYLSK